MSLLVSTTPSMIHPERAVSFAGLGFLTFYLVGKLRLFDTRGYAVSALAGAIMSARLWSHAGQGVVVACTPRTRCLGGPLAYHGLPTCVVLYTAWSRAHVLDITDHWEDVLTGSTLGLGIAYFSYRQYYPHLAFKTAHIPFTTRFDEVKYDMDDEAMFGEGHTDNEEDVGLMQGTSDRP